MHTVRFIELGLVDLFRPLIAAKRGGDVDPGILLVGLVILALILGISAAASARQKAKQEEAARIEAVKRRERIFAKYGRTEVAERIARKVIWVGESAAQLTDSLGSPADIDQKVLKTKTKAIWKYYPRGANRYALRVTVENNLVVGWDEKL